MLFTACQRALMDSISCLAILVKAPSSGIARVWRVCGYRTRNIFFEPMMGSKIFITNAEAEKVIRNCGQQTPRLWPNCFSAYAAEFYCEDGSMYSNSGGDKTLISERIPGSISWNFHTEGKVLAVGLQYGNVVISTLITE